MAKYPIRFLEGYTEVFKESNHGGWEIVHFRKDGKDYIMDVETSQGLRCGIANIVGANGITVETVTYANGHLNGECRHYYDNGALRMKCMVVNDVLEGKFTEYDESEKVICSGKYVNGRRIENEDEKKKEKSSSGFGAAAAAGTAAAGATAAATGAAGGAAALLGFGSPGIAAGSAAAKIMSAAWTSGVGTGLVSAAQSAGALFVNAVGGSTLAAAAAVAVPIAVGAAVAVGVHKYLNKEDDNDGEDKKDDQKK